MAEFSNGWGRAPSRPVVFGHLFSVAEEALNTADVWGGDGGGNQQQQQQQQHQQLEQQQQQQQEHQHHQHRQQEQEQQQQEKQQLGQQEQEQQLGQQKQQQQQQEQQLEQHQQQEEQQQQQQQQQQLQLQLQKLQQQQEQEQQQLQQQEQERQKCYLDRDTWPEYIPTLWPPAELTEPVDSPDGGRDAAGNDVSALASKRVFEAARDAHIASLCAEAGAIRGGTHPEIERRKGFLQKLQQKRGIDIERFKIHQMEVARQVYLADKEQIEQAHDDAIEQCTERLLAEIATKQAELDPRFAQPPLGPATRGAVARGDACLEEECQEDETKGQTNLCTDFLPKANLLLAEEELDFDICRIYDDIRRAEAMAAAAAAAKAASAGEDSADDDFGSHNCLHFAEVNGSWNDGGGRGGGGGGGGGCGAGGGGGRGSGRGENGGTTSPFARNSAREYKKKRRDDDIKADLNSSPSKRVRVRLDARGGGGRSSGGGGGGGDSGGGGGGGGGSGLPAFPHGNSMKKRSHGTANDDDDIKETPKTNRVRVEGERDASPSRVTSSDMGEDGEPAPAEVIGSSSVRPSIPRSCYSPSRAAFTVPSSD